MPKTKLTIYYDNGKPFTINNVVMWAMSEDRNIRYQTMTVAKGNRQVLDFKSGHNDVAAVVETDGNVTKAYNYNPNHFSVKPVVYRRNTSNGVARSLDQYQSMLIDQAVDATS